MINVNQNSSVLNLYKKRNNLSPRLNSDVLSENNSKKKNKDKVSNKEKKPQSDTHDDIVDGLALRNNPEKKKKTKKRESEVTAMDSASEAIVIFTRRPKEKENMLEKGTVSVEDIEVKPRKKKKKKDQNKAVELKPDIVDQNVDTVMVKSKKKRNKAQVEDAADLEPKPKLKTEVSKGIEEADKSPTELKTEVEEPEEISTSKPKKRNKKNNKIDSGVILQETEIKSKHIKQSNGTNSLEEITLKPKKKRKNKPKEVVDEESKDKERPIINPEKSMKKEIVSLGTLEEEPSEPNCDSSDEDLKTPSKRRRKAFSDSRYLTFDNLFYDNQFKNAPLGQIQ